MQATKGLSSPYKFSRTEVLFDLSQSDPFFRPSVPRSHYFPSNISQHCSKSTKSILTPEKISKISIEDNTSYIPLNYSFLEEDANDVVQSSIVSSDHRFRISTAPSEELKNNIRNNTKSSIAQNMLQPKTQNTTSNVFPTKNTGCEDDQYSLKTVAAEKSSSERLDSTHIAEFVNRFRHSQPLPPSRRKRPTSFIPSDVSAVDSNPSLRNRKKSSDEVKSDLVFSPKQFQVSSYGDSQVSSYSSYDDCQDDELHDLQLQVEKLLKKSSAVSSLPSRNLTSSGTFTSETDTPEKVSLIQNLPDISKSTNTANQTTTSENINTNSLTSRISHPPTSSTLSSFNYIKASNQQSLISPSINSPTLHTDILQQWRLKRKMEAAQAVVNNSAFNIHTITGSTRTKPVDEVYWNSSDRISSKTSSIPVENIARSVPNTSVSLIPSTTSQSSSVSQSLLNKASEDVSKARRNSFKENDEISKQKISSGSCLVSDDNLITSASSLCLNANQSSFTGSETQEHHTSPSKEIIICEKTSEHYSSTTSALVKKVVVERLFDQSNSSSATTCDTTINSAYNDKSNDATDNMLQESNIHSNNSAHSNTSTMKFDDPEQVLSTLLQNIKEDVLDFPDDLVLLSLREQRTKITDKLDLIQEKLMSFDSNDNSIC